MTSNITKKLLATVTFDEDKKVKPSPRKNITTKKEEKKPVAPPKKDSESWSKIQVPKVEVEDSSLSLKKPWPPVKEEKPVVKP